MTAKLRLVVSGLQAASASACLFTAGTATYQHDWLWAAGIGAAGIWQIVFLALRAAKAIE